MASDKVKGITIEIGGDTTGLDAALQDINERSRELSGELKAVEKALKLDPKNTEVLAQKQKLLAEQAKLAAERVDDIHKAQKEFNALVESGDIEKGSKEYNEFQREVATAEANLEKAKEAVKEFAKEHSAIAKVKDAVSSVKDAIEKMKNSVGGKIVAGAFKGIKTAASAAFDVMKAGVSAVGAVGTAMGAAAAKMTALTEETQEYRNNQSKLETSFQQAGLTARQAADTYADLYAVLGDDGQATEAAQHLAKMATSQEDLANWTTIATGVYATFGDSLPIEGLAEAANETAKTGALTGSLADALNWAGVSEEEFQNQLDACATEQERSALITETLNGLYGEAAEAYRENNAELLKANEASAKMTDAMAEIGEAVQPMVNTFKAGSADLAKAFADMVKNTAYHGDVSDTFVNVMAGAIEDMVDTITEEVPKFVDAAADIFEAVLEAIDKSMPKIMSAAEKMVPEIIGRILKMIPQMAETGIRLLTSLVQQMPMIIRQIVEALPSMIDSIIDALLDAIPLLIEAGVELFVAIVENIDEIIVTIVARLPEILTAIVNGILDGIPDMISAGADLIAGLVDGMFDMLGWVGRKISEFGSEVLDSIKDVFGIASPSKLFRDEVGKYLAQGLGEGFTDQMEDVAKDMERSIPTEFDTKVNAAYNADRAGVMTPLQQAQAMLGAMQNSGGQDPNAGDTIYNITISAASVKEFNDIIRMAQSERQGIRMGYVGG